MQNYITQQVRTIPIKETKTNRTGGECPGPILFLPWGQIIRVCRQDRLAVQYSLGEAQRIKRLLFA